MLLIALLALAWLCLMAFAAIAAPILWVRQSRLEQSMRELKLRAAEIDSATWKRAVAERPATGPALSERERPVSPRPEEPPRLPEEPAAVPERPAPAAAATPTPTVEADPGARPAPRPADQAPLPRAPRRDTPRLDVPSLEELIGVRLYVWVGALALFLAGAFLVKYGIDQGWITPAVRVAFAILLGTSLVMAAEWLRPSTALATHGLSAAGIGVLFVGFYAATSVYELVPASVGFLLMGLTGVTGVGLSLRHGMLVGVVGLLGGYLTPLLVHAEAPGSEAVLTLYVLLLFATVLAASRERSWWPVAAMAMLGNLFWATAIAGGTDTASSVFWSNLLAAASALAYIVWAPKPRLPLDAGLQATSPGDAPTGGSETAGPSLDMGRAFPDALALLGALAVAGATLNGASATLWPWWFLAALGAAAIALGRVRSDHEVLPWTAAGATAAFVLSWADGAASSGLSPVGALAAVGGLGTLFALGAYGAAWGARVPWRWAALSGASAVVYFLIAYTGSIGMALRGASLPIHWGALAAVLAAIATAGVAAYAARGPRGAHLNETVGVLSATATAFLALAVPLSVGREWFAVAWSLELAALAWLAHRTGFSSLRWPIWPLGAIVAADLLLPALPPGPLGDLPILNWLLYTYGIPIVSFAVAASYAYRASDLRQANVLSWGALTFGFVLIGLEIRHAFSETVLATWPHAPFVAASTYGIAWLGYGLAVYRLSGRWPLRSLREGGLVAIAGGLAAVGLLSLGAANPLWQDVSVGSVPILNWLLYAYGLPALLALAASRQLAEKGPAESRLSHVCMASSLALAFALIGFEIRHAFSATALRDWPQAPFVAASTYGIAWLAFGLAVYRASDRWRIPFLREGGLVGISIGLATVGLVSVAAANPLWNHVSVGSVPVLNWLIYAYGLPAVLALWAGGKLRGRSAAENQLSRVCMASSLGLVFVLATLTVRQMFHGAYLDVGALTTAENYAYSLCWVLLGSTLLVIGVQTGSRLARWASLPIMLLTVTKVFLFDVAAINDLFRVLSFLGLGLSLVALGWVYQRFVFAQRPA